MREYRYFITDESCIGSLVKCSHVNGNAMLLLMGYITKSRINITVEKAVDILVSNFNFEVIKQSIDKVTLNTCEETPYTYYDLIDEGGYCEADGYMYTDIAKISEYFSGEKSSEILRSIKAFSQRPFS